MFENIENIKIISSLHKTSNSFGSVESRKANGFIIRTKGRICYEFPNKSFELGAGEMMFIPKGSRYIYKIISDVESECTIINMDGDFGDARPCPFSIENFYDAEYMMNHFPDLWNFGTNVQKLQCYSLLYSLISFVANSEVQKYEVKKKYDIIEPAVSYLKRNIYNCGLKIDGLHEFCGISDTYFRKIFISKFGMSPKNYVISKRVSYAKSMIDSGEFTTVKELSSLVGYNDALYFGKVFKKHYGITPTEMNR